MRTVKGILRVVIIYFLYNRFLSNKYLVSGYMRDVKEYLSSMAGEGFGNFVAYLLFALVAMFLFYHTAKGLFQIFTPDGTPGWAKGYSLRKDAWKAFIDLLNGRNMTTSKNVSNIDKFKSFRNAKLGTMSDAEKMSEWAKTAGIDAMDNSRDSNTAIAKEYLNSKLGTMSQEEGYEFIRNTFGGE